MKMTPEYALRWGLIYAVVGPKGNILSAHRSEAQAKQNSGALRKDGARIAMTETLLKVTATV